MTNAIERLKELVRLGEKLPGGKWRWRKSYELDELHWAISTPESEARGRILDTHTVLFSGPYEQPPKYDAPVPSPIMQLWVAAANARPDIAKLLEVVEAARDAEFELNPWVRQEEAKHGREFRAGIALRRLDAALRAYRALDAKEAQ